MTTKQPEALHLADALAVIAVCPLDFKVARELRRLHEVNVELLEALKLAETYCPIDSFAGEVARATIAKATGDTR